MGLADFLATAGQGKTLGHVAEAFGGQTPSQQRVDEFVHKQLPALLQEIHGNTDETKVRELGGKFLAAAMTAGMPADGAEKLMESTIGPALQGIQREGLNKLRSEYAGQPAIPGESRQGPEGLREGPLTPQGNFIDPKAATPDKPLDLNFMMKYADLTGANPEQRRLMLGTPADIAGKEISNRKTLTEINKEQQAQRQRENLPNTPLGQGLPSLQDIGTLAPAGLPQTLPVREKPNDPLMEKRGQVMDAQINNLNHLANRPFPAPGGAVSPHQQFNEAASMRRDFQTQSAPFQKVRDSFNRIQASAQNPSPAGDLSMVFNYMKMLDPGSVVRESEFATAAAARPLLERVGLSWDTVGSLWSGKKLTPGQRQDFLNRSNQLYQTEAKQHEQRVNETKRMATGFGINPDLIISDMGAQPAPAAPAYQGRYSEGAPSGSGSGSGPTGQGAGAPPVGTVSKGYRFKGGNPADRNSWEKVQ